MRRITKRMVKWDSPDSDYYIWDTIKRLDETPVANMYHFVGDANKLIVFPERERPCITLQDGMKILETYINHLSPRPTLPGNEVRDWRHHGEPVWVWRMSPKYTPETWLEEVKKSGEMVCWASRKFVETWVKRKYRPYILVTWELPIPTPVGVVIAAFRPQYVYFPYNDLSNLEVLEQINRYGATMAERKVRVANTVVYTNPEKTAFLPLSTKAL